MFSAWLLLLALLTAAICATPPAAGSGAVQSPLSAWMQLSPFHRVHVFYYLWYGNPTEGGRFKHWDHAVIDHWNAEHAQKWPRGFRYEPPDCIHSPYYPLRGPYASDSVETLRQHVLEVERAGIGVLVASWWGPESRAGSTDTQGVNTDTRTRLLASVIEGLGAETQVKLAFHMEPYEGRTVHTVREDLQHLVEQYKDSSAVLRVDGKPVYYMYDSYRIDAQEWSKLLRPDGELTVRGTALDGWFIALYVAKDDEVKQILPGGFDGFYTYFASDVVSPGSQPQNWRAMADWAAKYGRVFIPSVGPGYDDRKIRPWNADATRERQDGQRYSQQWETAINSGAVVISVTSYNEYGEGTQIEPVAAQQTRNGCSYHDYGSSGPFLYMDLTRKWSNAFASHQRYMQHLRKARGCSSISSGGGSAIAAAGTGGCAAPEGPPPACMHQGKRDDDEGQATAAGKATAASSESRSSAPEVDDMLGLPARPSGLLGMSESADAAGASSSSDAAAEVHSEGASSTTSDVTSRDEL